MGQEQPAELAGELDLLNEEGLALRLTLLAQAGTLDGPEWEAIQIELARRRVEGIPPPPPPAPSLRSLILAVLTKAPGSTPSDVARSLDRTTTVVSRVLGVLLTDGIVTYEPDPDDGRIRHYKAAVPAAAGADEPSAPTASEQQKQHLALVVAAAVEARRQKHDLRYAEDRLTRAMDQATSIGASDLALLSRRELITTLRQAGRADDLQRRLDELSDIERGVVPTEPHLQIAAGAALDYELGRQIQIPPRERLDHLTAASTAFRRCQGLPHAQDWCPREGWALLASAELWREQTEFGVALAQAERATSVFRAFDDTYGAAEATRLQGFCHRLRGDFVAAISVLEEARELANASSSARCAADVLLQLGDAYRCAEDVSTALEFLTEATEIAKQLGRDRTLGFSLSSTAAIAFGSGDLDEAWATAERAEKFLKSTTIGTALNTRRRAVIARELGRSGEYTMLKKSRQLFEESLGSYRALSSPAGVAACHLGIGRIDPEGAFHSESVSELVALASTGSGRLLLPLDPWIPSLLNSWAVQTDAADVIRLADWTYRSDREQASADEMAGEPRVESRMLAA